MDLTWIEQLIGLVERSRVIELVYAEGGTRVRITKAAVPPSGARTAAPDQPARETVLGDPTQGRPPPAGSHVVAAGMAGTFYRSPSPGEAPFVSEGDRVDDGQTLAILEAMKMLNPIEADRAGRVQRILAADGATVEVGTPLFDLAIED